MAEPPGPGCGFVLACLAATTVLSLPFWPLSYIAWPLILFVVFIFGALALPLYLLAARAKLVRWWTAALAGIGAALILPLAGGFLDGFPSASEMLWFGAWLSAAGATGGMTFWWAVRKPEQP